MSRKILIFLGVLLVAGSVFADEVQLRADHPDKYTVKKGDTLWDISGRFLTHPWQWPDIWKSNPQIKDPNLIYPGDVLALEYTNGGPRLTVSQRMVKLSPTIREYRHAEAIHAIPLDAIRQFLSRPRVVTEDAIARAAYIVGSQDQHLVIGSGDRVYVRGLGKSPLKKYSVFRRGDVYRDPDTNQILGYEADYLGDARVEKFGDPATVYIVSTTKEIVAGDRLMPQESNELSEFVPRAPAAPVDGKIISVMNGVSEISQHQVVVLNRGAKAGLKPGDVLAIYQAGAVINDKIGSEIADRERQDALKRAEKENPSAAGRLAASIANDLRSIDRNLRDFVGTPIQDSNSVQVKLPDERAGELMVFRTFDAVSYGLVMNIQRPVHLLDNVRNP